MYQTVKSFWAIEVTIPTFLELAPLSPNIGPPLQDATAADSVAMKTFTLRDHDVPEI